MFPRSLNPDQQRGFDAAVRGALRRFVGLADASTGTVLTSAGQGDPVMEAVVFPPVLEYSVFTSGVDGLAPHTGGVAATYYLDASGSWSIPGASAIAQTVDDVAALRRDFRLLLRAWLVTGLPVPPGLDEAEVVAALETE